MTETPGDDDIPSGMPDEDAPEAQPLGPSETDPDGEATEPGADAMPGIPTEGEPPSAG